MLHIQEAIVVEGRYDKNALSQVADTLILRQEAFKSLRTRRKWPFWTRRPGVGD